MAVALSACGGSNQAPAPVTQTVTPPANSKPVVALENPNIDGTVGTSFSYDATQNGITFSDPDGDTLSYSIRFNSENRRGLSAEGGIVSGIADSLGSVNMTVIATDPHGETAADNFSVRFEYAENSFADERELFSAQGANFFSGDILTARKENSSYAVLDESNPYTSFTSEGGTILEPRKLNPSPFIVPNDAEIIALENAIRPVSSRLNDGIEYGAKGRTMYRRDIDGNWELILDTIANNEQGRPSLIIPSGDGEVLIAVGFDGILRSTNWSSDLSVDVKNITTWEKVLDADGASQVLPWGLAANGRGNVYSAQYSAGRPQDSTFIRRSTDFGLTWENIYSLDDIYNEERMHLHFVEIDYFADHLPDHIDRLLFSYHSLVPINGEFVYRVMGVDFDDTKSLAEQNFVVITDTAVPTVAVATPNGIVYGSDNGPNNGVFRSLRTTNLEDMTYDLLLDIKTSSEKPTSNFSVDGQWYPDKQVAILTFISQITTRFSSVVAADASTATEILRSPKPLNNGSGYWEQTRDSDGQLVVFYRDGNVENVVKMSMPDREE